MKKYKLGFNIRTYLNTVITKVWELRIISPLTGEMKIQELCRSSDQNTDSSTRNCCNCTNNHSSCRLLMNLLLSFLSPRWAIPGVLQSLPISSSLWFLCQPLVHLHSLKKQPMRCCSSSWLLQVCTIIWKIASTSHQNQGSLAATAQGHLQLSFMFLIPESIWAHPSHAIKSISAFCMNKLLISHRDWKM